MLTLGVRPGAALKIFGKTLVQVRWALATIFMILAIAFIMNWSGQTTTLGRFLAGAGAAYALISPVIGWVGVVVTGSDNSTNALFGHLQVVAAKETGLSPVLLAASNTTGGVLGKMLSPQSIAIGAAAVGLIGREGDVFRSVFGWADRVVSRAQRVGLSAVDASAWLDGSLKRPWGSRRDRLSQAF